MKDYFTILECEYIETFDKWENQKKKILEKFIRKGYNKNEIKVTRVKSDTKGLRCYTVEKI